MKIPTKKEVFVALEEALENCTSNNPQFCRLGCCYRKPKHKGMCVLMTNIPKK